MRSSLLSDAELTISRAITTGIPELDGLIGGYSVGSMILVVGPPGSYQRLFAHQFAWEAARAGYHAILVLFDQHPETLKQEMKARGWTLNNDPERGRLHFVDCFSPIAKGHPPALLDTSIATWTTIGRIRDQNPLPIAIVWDSATQVIQRYGFDQALGMAHNWKARAAVDRLVVLSTMAYGAHTPTESAALEASATMILRIRESEVGELFLKVTDPSRPPQPDLRFRVTVEGIRLSIL